MDINRHIAVTADDYTCDIYPVETFSDDYEKWRDSDGKPCFPPNSEVTELWSKEKFTVGSVVCAVRVNATDLNTDREQEFCFVSADNYILECLRKAKKQMSRMSNLKISIPRSDNQMNWDTVIDTTKLEGNDKHRSFRFVVETVAGVVSDDPRGDREQAPFRYRWCLPFERKSRKAVTEMVVKKVQFGISRYGEHTETLAFHKPVSVAFAVSAVEEYLSEPLDPDYYDRIKGDLFMSEIEWKQAQKAYENRGSCLTDCIFLEGFDESKEEKGLFVLSCGS